jgi:predicted metalloprotease with PDZ domain
VNRICSLIFAVVAALACAGLAAPSRVEYVFTPVMEAGVLAAVEVDLTFRGDADGETELRLPNEWGGQSELWRGIAALEVVSGAEMRVGVAPSRRALSHRPGALIHVRYRLIQDWAGAPSAEAGNPNRPVIQPTYFHFVGDAGLVTPDVHGASWVRVRTHNFPRGWSFASDLQHPGLNIARVHSSISIGGDYRVLRGPDPNIRVAIRGAWSFADADFTAQLSEIIAGQRRFWSDPSSPYLVTVTQITAPDPGWTSVGGTGLEDAFAFFATPNAPAQKITRTLAHESLHTWIPGRIGGMPEDDEEANYWLSEGFTDFFTPRLLVREQFWTPAQFAEELNEALRDYARSPVQREPNTRVAADFWNDPLVQKLPYQRGRLLAAIWDAQMRAEGSRDLDDVVVEMRARAEAGDPLKAAAMFPVVALAMGLDVSADIAAHVDRGAPIVLPEEAFAPCGRIITRQAPEFHRGFDIDATEANNRTIVGVVRGGPAYAAGMRDGMVLVRRDGGELGNAELEIGYVVRDGATERTLRYMPRGRDSVTQQSLVLDEALAGEQLAQCVRVLGGN